MATNISEFERNKPIKTHKAFLEVKNKYEKLLKETVIMDDKDSTRVEMASAFLKELRGIYKKFIAGE